MLNNKSGGHSLPVRAGGSATRDGELSRGQAEVFALSNFASLCRAVYRTIYGMMLVSFRSALLICRCAKRELRLLRPRPGPTSEHSFPALSKRMRFRRSRSRSARSGWSPPVPDRPKRPTHRRPDAGRPIGATAAPAGEADRRSFLVGCAAAQQRRRAAASSNASPRGIYFESKSEPLAGQLAVGQVIANRAQVGGRFPSTYCGVLFQRGQFSFVHGRSLPTRPALEPPVADRGRDRQDRRPGSARFVGRQRPVLPRPLRVAGLAAEARRIDRQSRLLPLDVERGGSGRAKARPLSFWHRFVLVMRMATRPILLLHRCSADRRRCRARRDAAVLPPGSVRGLRNAAPNGRRADLMAIDAKGGLTIVEIKVAKADLLGDGKWPDYLDYCDRFFWAVPPALAADPARRSAILPSEAGLIVADRYDAVSFARPRTGRSRRRGARPSCCVLLAAPRGACRRRSTRRSAKPLILAASPRS